MLMMSRRSMLFRAAYRLSTAARGGGETQDEDQDEEEKEQEKKEEKKTIFSQGL